MTKEAAIQAFFSSFGWTAYPHTDVPDDAVYPWVTYELTVGGWGEQAGITVNLWDYSDSNTAVNAKAQQMSEYIGMGGRLIQCDGGAIWVKRGSPWCQSIREENDRAKRRYINITLEFLTAD